MPRQWPIIATLNDLEEPEIIEGYGTPDVFANGAVLRDEGEVFTLVYFVGRAGENHEVFRVHMPRGDFLRFRLAAKRMLEARGH
ncbi:MAG: hypothetical protein AB7F22_10420 [Reyranella sp.]|uniref:hypothetical protein n=1 Tax=Reyranella sp. TaxID=1929291 RepID=UPI003D0B6B65